MDGRRSGGLDGAGLTASHLTREICVSVFISGTSFPERTVGSEAQNQPHCPSVLHTPLDPACSLHSESEDMLLHP